MAKIKLIILITIGLIILLTSCNSEGLNQNSCINNVRKIFPNSKIYNFPDENKYIFYVVDSTGIKRVETLFLSNNNIGCIKVAIEK